MSLRGIVHSINMKQYRSNHRISCPFYSCLYNFGHKSACIHHLNPLYEYLVSGHSLVFLGIVIAVWLYYCRGPKYDPVHPQYPGIWDPRRYDFKSERTEETFACAHSSCVPKPFWRGRPRESKAYGIMAHAKCPSRPLSVLYTASW